MTRVTSILSAQHPCSCFIGLVSAYQGFDLRLGIRSAPTSRADETPEIRTYHGGVRYRRSHPRPASAEVAQMSVSLVAGILIAVMVIVGAVVVRTQGDSPALGASPSTLAAPVPTTASPSDIAQLAPTTQVGVTTTVAAPVDPNTPSTLAAVAGDPGLPDSGLATPQSAARNLWDAWRDGDGPRGGLYASPQAVKTLFKTAWTPQVRLAGCTVTARGWLCRFEGPKLRWDLTIDGSETEGYRVTHLAVGAPVGDLLPPNTLPTASSLPVPTATRLDGSPVATFGPAVPSTVPGSTVDAGAAGATDTTAVDGATTTRVKSAKSSKSTRAGKSVPGSNPKKSKKSKTSTTQGSSDSSGNAPETKPPAPRKPDPAPAEPAGGSGSDSGAPKPVPVANPE
jgi:hypothetical protein